LAETDHKARILVVDDEPDVCRLLCRYLVPEGYECTTAGSGESAVKHLETEDFDMVMSDIMMPGMSGIDLLAIIYRLFPSVPVIVVTAVDDRDTGIMAMELGAAGYIIKPFRKNDILINVATALKRRRTKSRMSQLTQPAERKDRRVIIPADDLRQSATSGMSDVDIMQRFNLSSDSLIDLLSQLHASGQLTQADVSRRESLAPQTVAVDIAEKGDADEKKPVIRVGEAVESIRTGMDDLALMKRFGLSAKGLKSLFRKLLDTGFLRPEEFYGRSRSDQEFVLDMRQEHRRYLVVTTNIWEADRPGTVGQFRDVTEHGLGTVGIRARVGEKKSLVIETGAETKGGNICFEAGCIWSDNGGPEGLAVAGFQIRKISKEDMANLRELIRALTLLE